MIETIRQINRARFGEELRDRIVDYLKNNSERIAKLNSYNLLDDYKHTDRTSEQGNGVTYTWNADGSCTVSGTASSGSTCDMYNDTENMPPFISAGDTLYIKHPNAGNVAFRLYFYNSQGTSSGAYVNAYDDTIVTVPVGTVGMVVRLAVTSGRTVSATVKPQMLKGFSNAELTKIADNLSAELVKHESGNLLPPKTAGTTVSAGLTFVSDGNGNYHISGSQAEQSETAFYYIYHSETDLLDGVTPGDRFVLRVSIDVQIPIQIRFYNGTSWTLAVQTLNDAEFTVPSDAVGMSVRFIGLYGTKYTNGLEPSVCRPEIVRLNSVGYFGKSDCPPQVMLTIIDDDGHSKFYSDLLPIIEAKHVPITSAVICKRIDTSTGAYMTWAQVQECHLAGADIVSHTYEHITPENVIANSVTVDELVEDYQRAYNDLSVHGIISPSLVFNNDSAKYGKQQKAAKQVYDYAFSNQTVHLNNDNLTDVINHRGTTAPYNIKRCDVTPTTGTNGQVRTIDQLKDMIDKLVLNGEGWLIWMTHTSSGDWPNDSSEASKLASAIDYALAQGVKIVSCMTGIKYIMRH